MKLSINRCPVHQTYWSISIDGDGTGRRITSSKCCGRWETVRAFELSKNDWEELSQLAAAAAKGIEPNTSNRKRRKAH